jgi:hypothetical protein
MIFAFIKTNSPKDKLYFRKAQRLHLITTFCIPCFSKNYFYATLQSEIDENPEYSLGGGIKQKITTGNV